MEAILIATGEAQKLHPITDDLPTPLVPVVNRPLVFHTLELLARFGVTHVVAVLQRLGGAVEAQLGDGRRWGLSIEYALLREAGGWAGAVARAAPLISKRAIILWGDQFLDADIEVLERKHSENGTLATVWTTTSPGIQTDSPRQPVGCASGQERLALLESPVAALLEKDALDALASRRELYSPADALSALERAGIPCASAPLQGYWNPLQDFGQWRELERTYLESAAGSSVPIIVEAFVKGRQIAPGIWIGHNPLVHPSARLRGPLLIGDNCRIGRQAELCAAVIGDEAMIDAEATVSNSTVLAHTYVGRMVNVTDRIAERGHLVDIRTGEYAEIVDSFLLTEATAEPWKEELAQAGRALLALLLGIALTPVWLPVLLAMTGALRGRPLTRIRVLGTRAVEGKGAEPREFAIWRFATRDAQGNQPRLGAVLQGLGVHRLPELINVVSGDLGFVGVKPLATKGAGQLTETWQTKRYETHAGLTGLWYTDLPRNADLDEIVVSDAYYAATRSVAGDVRILLDTAKVWWKRHFSRDRQTARSQRYPRAG
jgi:mannose-1-phosphate guanylyltransferase / phosphomannomutase